MVLDVWDEILRNEPAPWVRQRYLEKFRNYLGGRWHDREMERFAAIINRMPEGPALLNGLANDPERILDQLSPHLTPELRAEVEPHLKQLRMK